MACNISMPILGLDFLGHNHLLVDAAGSYLLDSSILESIPVLSSNSSNSSSDLYTALLSTSEEFCDFLSKYPDVVSSKGFFTIDSAIRFLPCLTCRCLLKPAGVMQKSCNLQGRILQQWIIQHSCFPWASPLHMLKKPDGSWRPCGNYHRLHTQTLPDRYP